MVAALTLQAVNTGVFVKTSETVYAGDQNAPATLSFSQSGNAKTITWSAVNGLQVTTFIVRTVATELIQELQQ